MEIEKIPQHLRIANDVAPQKFRHESFHIFVRFLVTITFSFSYLKSNNIRTTRNVAMRASIFLFDSLSQLLSQSPISKQITSELRNCFPPKVIKTGFSGF
jgi:hypothetical protein